MQRPGPVGYGKMTLLSSHLRDPNRRAARLTGGVALALALAIVAGAWVLFGDRQGLRPGAGAGRPGPAPGVVADGPGTDTGDAIAQAGREAVESGRGRDQAGGGEAGGDGRRDPVDNDDLLAALNHLERQIDAAMARARESVVALEYTPVAAPVGQRRVASGVVINHWGEILSVRIDPPPVDPAAGPGAAARKGGDPLPIVARDYLGRGHAARWVAADPLTGLTLLRVAPRAVRAIRLTSEGPRLGSQVFVVGNPFGLGHSVNRGHVAGLDRVLELGRRQLGGLIQVQVPLYPGDSGAAVVDIRGRLLGLIRGGLAIPGADARTPSSSDPGGTAGRPVPAGRMEESADLADDAGDAEPDSDFGFAVPTRDSLWVADQLRAHGRVDRAYLGVVLEKMPVSDGPIADPEPARAVPAGDSSTASAPDGAGSWRGAGGGIGSSSGTIPETTPATADADMPPVPGEGARILEVKPDTPAALAGLRPRDRIVELDGQLIRSRNDLIDKLNCIAARTTIVLGVVRDGEPARPRFEVKVQTASHPVQPAAGAGRVSGPPADPRSVGAGVAVTPTAARVQPAAPGATSSGSNPSPPAAAPSATPRQDAATAPAPAPSPPDRSDPAPPATVPPTSLNDLKLSVPRGFVERIELIERRLKEIEQARGAAKAGAIEERDPQAQPAGSNRERDGDRKPAGRPSGPSNP
jgi:serine protease Do